MVNRTLESDEDIREFILYLFDHDSLVLDGISWLLLEKIGRNVNVHFGDFQRVFTSLVDEGRIVLAGEHHDTQWYHLNENQ